MRTNITNDSYSAIVIEVKNTRKLDGLDNLVALPSMWSQALISKEIKEWTIGILFTAETSLSNDFCKYNNLFRDSSLNHDEDVKWYMESNRRVRAIKLRWEKSNSIFMPLSSLSYITSEYNTLKVWDKFNEIDWIMVCEKHINKQTERNNNKIRGKEKKFERIDNKRFPEHLDSDNYWRNCQKYKPNDNINITQKLHWTSVRLGNVRVKRKLNFIENIINKFINVNDTEYDVIYWSRRVIKNGNIVSWNSYYKHDIYKDIADKYGSLIPKDYILYWEIIWRAGNSPIQKWYTYNLKQWECELYVYRISIVNEDWLSTDLSWDAMVDVCEVMWIKVVPLVWLMKFKDFNVDDYMDKIYSEEYSNAIPLSDKWTVDEGIIVRTEWLSPYLTKAKCQKFLEYETKFIDSGEVDIESQG